jgi:hypothetical protein
VSGRRGLVGSTVGVSGVSETVSRAIGLGEGDCRQQRRDWLLVEVNQGV